MLHAARFLVVALATFLAAQDAVAGELGARNLGFETWNEERTLPEGWSIGRGGAVPGFTTRADCDGPAEGRCALRVEGLDRPDRMPFIPIGQGISAASAAGARVKLTGAIRTENVEGYAGLWMRVDAPRRGMVALRNMAMDGPRGTTGWQRFRIEIPVAVADTRLVFGVMLAGLGRAWFDDLQLEIDRSEPVLMEPPAPPRPRASAALEEDDALPFVPEAHEAVHEAWREDVRERHRPIRSLFSEDFSDLAFLAPLLERKRVIQLGEAGHGVAEFNWLKVRLVKYLHQELGFDVIAFESSMSECDWADGRIGSAPPLEVMRSCIFGVWHTTETLGLFEYLDRARKESRPVSLAGFDIQSSSAARPYVAARFKAMLEAVDPELARGIEEDERRLLSFGSGRRPVAEAVPYAERYRKVADVLALNRERLAERFPRAIEVDLAIQEAKSRAALAELFAAAPGSGFAIRDRAMADNLDFVLDKLHPGRKVIVWAHNSHIARHDAREGSPRPMGSWVAERRGSEVYTIGLYMGSGVAAFNNRERYVVQPSGPNSLEAILASAGRRIAFVDLSLAATGGATGWMFEELDAHAWGRTPVRIVPVKTYDALIYVDTVTPPEYL